MNALTYVRSRLVMAGHLSVLLLVLLLAGCLEGRTSMSVTTPSGSKDLGGPLQDWTLDLNGSTGYNVGADHGGWFGNGCDCVWAWKNENATRYSFDLNVTWEPASEISTRLNVRVFLSNSYGISDIAGIQNASGASPLHFSGESNDAKGVAFTVEVGPDCLEGAECVQVAANQSFRLTGRIRAFNQA
jgi:hypothetical protein